MSFLNNIGGLLSQFTGGATPAPEQLEAAATEHIGDLNAGELAAHLTDSAGNLNTGQLGALASALLGALRDHGHDEATVEDAGVSTTDAQAGDANAVTELIAHAQQNPAALKDAAIDFIRTNPQAVERFAPDFLKGIIAKFAS